MSVGWAALILWPIVCIVLFQRARLPVAFCASLLGGFLLLPNGISRDFPLLPELNKTSIPTLTVLLLTAIAAARPRQSAFVLGGWLPRDRVLIGLVVLLITGIFGTVLTNGDPLNYGFRILPGMRLYDGFSLLLTMLVLILPFFIARRVLATTEGHWVLVLATVIAALIYSLPTLYEVRMSPQLHRIVYGFFPHDWLQAVRAGGFRPSVFLEHGLLLGLFLACATIGAAGLFRVGNDQDRLKWIFGMAWLMGVLVLAKSLGVLLITLVVVPIVLFCKPRVQMLAAACLAGIVLVYPMLRAADVVPTGPILSLSHSIDPQRASSLQFRLDNENLLLAKAAERPVFGWGIWSRNRVFDDQGRDIAVTDGWWVGTLGVGGWAQYLSFFGLMCWPIIALYVRRRDEIEPITAVLALMLVANLVDLIPNAGVMPLTWMMAGALAGRLDLRQAADEEARSPAKAAVRRELIYARSLPKREKPAPAGEPRAGRRGGYSRPIPASGHRR